MISLRGKVALITGGSRGIGLAIAKNFAAKGASTILVARNPARLTDAIAAVEAVNYTYTPPSDEQQQTKQLDHDVVGADYVPFYTGVTGDVSKAGVWDDLVRKLKNGQLSQQPLEGDSSGTKFKPDRIDVLVNCAGVTQNSLLWSTSSEMIAEILNTNLRSALLGCKAIARYMEAQRNEKQRGVPKTLHGQRSIINVSSLMATTGGRGAVAYAASKAGLLGLTSSLVCEISSLGIRVNTLVPGYIKTDMTKELDKEKLTDCIPSRRMGTVEEVADAAAFLAQNTYANNCTLNIDGGVSAGMFRS